MPVFSALNSNDDKAIITATMNVISVPSKTCGSCGRTITYSKPSNATDVKNITVDATTAFPLNLRQTE